MTGIVEQLLHLALVALGALAVQNVTSLGVAIAVIAVAAVVLSVIVSAGPASVADAAPHPIRGIDASTPLPQSDPGAAGHPRPRAPEVVRAV